jgi:polyphosphate glucokinase
MRYVGMRGLKRLGTGAATWPTCGTPQERVGSDYLVLGGGNAKHIKNLPPDTRVGDNRNAFVGALDSGIRILTRFSGNEESLPPREGDD